MKKMTKQIFILKLNYPYESVNALLSHDIREKIFMNLDFKLKLFIGSSWSIKNSGFSFYGPNGLNIVFELKNLTRNEFIRENIYAITQINENKINIDLEFQSSLIKDTCDNTSIIEMRLNHETEKDLIIFESYIKISYLKKILDKIFDNIKKIFTQTNSEEKIPKTILNHSFIIKKNYKVAFNFFYNWNNMAKTLKTDKIWKIISEENDKKTESNFKNFSIIINDDIKIYYTIKSINEVKGKKIEIIYDKSGKNYVPALNNFIKFTFFNIDKDLSFFLYETHLPFNIVSSIYQTVSYYLFYCNYQSRKYMEGL